MRPLSQILANEGELAIISKYRLPSHPCPAAVVDMMRCTYRIRAMVDGQDLDRDTVIEKPVQKR